MQIQRSVGQYAVIGLILGLFFLTIYPLLSPVLLGLVAALVAYPFHAWIQKKTKSPKNLSAFCITLLITVGFVFPLVYVGITVVEQAIEIVPTIDVNRIFQNYERFLNLLPIPRSILQQNVSTLLTSLGGLATTGITKLASSLPSIVFGLLLFIVTLFYGLADGPELGRFILSVLPFNAQEVAALSGTADRICRGVIVGSLLAGLAQGCIIGTAYALLGIPGALLFGTITSILSFVPALGSGPTGIGGALYLWSQGNGKGAIIMLVATGLASISDNVIKPFILQGDGQLHPLLALVSAFGGLAIFGVSGIVLGPLFAALAIVMLNVLRSESA